MVKSILLREAGQGGRYVMACVPGAGRVAPKAVQAVLGEGWRRLHFASAEEIQAVTGCVQGAVAPVGLPDDVPVIFDEAIGRLARCNTSTGDPLCGLELAAADLLRVSRGRLAVITLGNNWLGGQSNTARPATLYLSHSESALNPGVEGPPAGAPMRLEVSPSQSPDRWIGISRHVRVGRGHPAIGQGEIGPETWIGNIPGQKAELRAIVAW